MPAFTFRPAAMTDLEPVMAMIHASEQVDEGYVRNPIEAEKASWELSTFSLATDSLSAWDDAGRCLGIAEVYDLRPEHVFANCYLNVDPEFRETAIPATLVAFVAERLERMAQEANPGLRVAGFTVGQREGWPLFRHYAARGWRVARHSWAMGRELSGVLPEPVWPNGITVRAAEESDSRAVHALDQEAFADHFNFNPMPFEDWRQMADAYASTPDFWLLAFDDADLVGISLNAPAMPEDPEQGYIGELGVRRDHRGQGLGLALLRASFRQLAEAGAKRVKLDVDSENLTGATRLYERAGMHVLEKRTTYSKDLRSGKTLWTTSLDGSYTAR
jgi:mycothiol synthase